MLSGHETEAASGGSAQIAPRLCRWSCVTTRRFGSVLVGVIALALALAPVAHAKPRCTHRGERVVASSPQLVVVAPPVGSSQLGSARSATDALVCDARSLRHWEPSAHIRQAALGT